MTESPVAPPIPPESTTYARGEWDDRESVSSAVMIGAEERVSGVPQSVLWHLGRKARPVDGGSGRNLEDSSEKNIV